MSERKNNKGYNKNRPGGNNPAKTGTRRTRTIAAVAAAVGLFVIAILLSYATGIGPFAPKILHEGDLSLGDIPAYSGQGYVEINGGHADFAEEEITTEAYESYSDLDSLGRCGTAEACLGEELMPTGERENISYIHPSGWHSDKYDFIEGGNVYNRSHLIAYSLAGENANEENLITGTRYLNADVMEPFESMTAWYIRDTGNHVMYRVTPIFEGENLIASGVHMMALSVEDGGVGIDFNVYIYNVQPGVEIDYATGDNWLAGGSTSNGTGTASDSAGKQNSNAVSSDTDMDAGESAATDEQQAASGGTYTGGEVTYIINERTGKFHYPDCEGAANISAGNRRESTGTREELIEKGYEPCGTCRP